MSETPGWVKSQRRARGDCEQCGKHEQGTEWAGTGELICWACCGQRQELARLRLELGL